MAGHEPPLILAISNAVYALLLRACPAEYRHAYGPWMLQAFRDLARDAYRRHGARGVVRVWLRILPDASATAFAEHILALKERRAMANAQLAMVSAQGISLGVGGTCMRKATVVLAAVLVAAMGIFASPLLFGYRPAVTAAPGVVLHVATQPGWLEGLQKAQQVMAEEVPSTYTLFGWSAGGVLYYRETDTAAQSTRTWAYRPGKGARPQLVVAPDGIVTAVECPREALLERVRARVWPLSAEPSTRPLHVRSDGLASPDGRWAAAVAKHIYGPEDVIVVALK